MLTAHHRPTCRFHGPKAPLRSPKRRLCSSGASWAALPLRLARLQITAASLSPNRRKAYGRMAWGRCAAATWSQMKRASLTPDVLAAAHAVHATAVAAATPIGMTLGRL